MKRVCVFCGSASGSRPVHAEQTRLLSKLADYAAMGIEGIFVIDPATNAYYIYQRGSLDHIGGSSTVSRCQIDFDEIRPARL